MSKLTDDQVRDAIWTAWMEADRYNAIDAEIKLAACFAGDFEPWELQDWFDSHTSEEISAILA